MTVSRPALLALPPLLPLGLTFAGAHGWPVVLVALVATGALTITVVLLSRRSRHRLAAIVTFSFSCVAYGVVAIFLPVPASLSIALLPGVVLVAGLLVGRAALLWTGFLSLGLTLVPAVLALGGLPLALPGGWTAPGLSGFASLLIVLAAVMTPKILWASAGRVDSAALQNAVYAIATLAAEDPQPPDFYRRIHGIIGELMPAKNFFVALYNQAAQTVSMPYFVDEKDYADTSWRPVGNGMTEYLLLTGKALLADRAELRRMVTRGEIVVLGAEPMSWLGVPLRLGDRVIGAMVVQSYSERERYLPEHLDIFTFISRQIAMAVNRRLAQSALRESEEKYRSMFSRSAVPLWEEDISALRRELSTLAIRGLTDLERHIAAHPEFVRKAAGLIQVVDVNDATLDLFEAGKEDLLGPLDRLLTDEASMGLVQALSAVYRGESHFECEGRVHTHQGKLVDAVIHYVIPAEDDRQHHMLVSVIDITERKRAEAERVKLEEQLRHSQKMESIGRLAGGMAHDFNNMLAPIIGYSDMILGGLAPDDPACEGLREILGAAERARDLTRQLLAFSRRQILSLQPMDLRSVMDGFERLVRHTIREDIRIDVRLPPVAVVVRADAGQMEQVLMNLVVNAQDAMPSGGVLTLSLEAVLPGDEPGRAPPDAATRRYALLSVSDTGIGMEPPVLEHLFEPFFTTKGVGKGTGLGLSTVYGIIEQHGGAVDVVSEPGKGSTFRIYLPRAEGDGSGMPTASAVQGEALRGSETVLVVEDLENVRRLATTMLKKLGYRVLSAANAEEAISLAEAEARSIDLLLTDVVMPGANGRELFLRLLASQPDLGVLYMSGYAGDTIARHGVLEPGVSLLTKPFTLEMLSRKVREVLDGMARGRG